MGDITVTYLTKSIMLPGIANILHTHDQWHFCLIYRGNAKRPDGSLRLAPACYCAPPGTIHGGHSFIEELYSINIYFHVHNQILSRKLELFPFGHLTEKQLFVDTLLAVAEQAVTLSPNQDFLDSAVSYYLHLLMEANHEAEESLPRTPTLAEQCVRYMEEHYMEPIRLEDVARYIGRTANYTSYLVRSSTGLTVVEHLTAIRIKNACSLLSYSNVPLEQVARACGFSDVAYFCRVFKSNVGITPNRYRTAYTATNLYYNGDLPDLAVPYRESAYTYIPGARKCVFWKTPLEYLTQVADSQNPAHI